jgi:cytochrome c oxidase subunit IV
LSDTRVDRKAGLGGGHSPGKGTYLRAYAALVCLTAATVGAAYLGLGRAAVLAALAVAAGKSVLVLLYFMGLRYERRVIIRILMPIVVATLAIFIGLTYTDILYR